MEDHMTLLHIIHPGRNHSMQTHSARTSIRYKTNQCEDMISEKPPGFLKSSILFFLALYHFSCRDMLVAELVNHYTCILIKMHIYI